MKVTYIHHSSFLVETDENYFLFDYFEGELPEFKEDKPLLVFASHRHGDHFSRDLDSVVSYIPRITNRAEESYIRVRLEAESAGRIPWKNLFYRSRRRSGTDSTFYRRIRCEDPGF